MVHITNIPSITPFDRLLSDKVGCFPPWAENNSVICSDKSTAKRAVEEAEKAVQSSAIRKKCPDPCDFLTINIGAKNVLDNNRADVGYMYYYFAPRIIQR